MIILGLDPGTHRVGWGVVGWKNDSLKALAYGCLEFKSGEAQSRLPEIRKNILALLKKYRPDAVAVEKIYFFKNKKTVIGVSEARGVIVASVLGEGHKLREFTPLEVKQAVSGYGRADKAAVQKMVRLILSLDKEPEPDDAADALAVAICCAHQVELGLYQS